MARTAEKQVNNWAAEKSTAWIDRTILEAAKEYGDQKRPRWSITDVLDYWIRKGAKASGRPIPLDAPDPTTVRAG
jgi:hypothetical protein